MSWSSKCIHRGMGEMKTICPEPQVEGGRCEWGGGEEGVGEERR